MTRAYIIAAKRTAVAPKGGALAAIESYDLAKPVIRALRDEARVAAADVDEVIFGNALYGGGNPARMAALAAGLPDEVAAITIDTQCCAGLDAIGLAAAKVRAGQRHCVIAGGLESFSRAPIRMTRPLSDQDVPIAYDRPPFAPFAERNPDMIEAAARLAERCKISRADQERFAIESHRKALATQAPFQEIVPVAGLARDAFTRDLTPQLCARLPLLAGGEPYGVTAATTAVEADAAAAVLVVSDSVLQQLQAPQAIEILDADNAGGDPAMPGLAPIALAQKMLDRHNLAPRDIGAVEIMEAFAAQAMACQKAFDFDPLAINKGGGALARGHPIGASGTILAVRLVHEIAVRKAGAKGLAMIAGAGGLASALLLAKMR